MRLPVTQHDGDRRDDSCNLNTSDSGWITLMETGPAAVEVRALFVDNPE